MPFAQGDRVTYVSGSISDTVVIDEVLDNGEYAVRFLDAEDVFTVHEDQLSD